MVDTVLLNAIEKLYASPNLTDEEYRKKIFHLDYDEDIDNLDFEKKDYDILEHVGSCPKRAYN